MTASRIRIPCIVERVMAYASFGLPSLFWAGNFIVRRAVRDLTAPLTLLTVRWVVAFACLLPFAVLATYRDGYSARLRPSLDQHASLTQIETREGMCELDLGGEDDVVASAGSLENEELFGRERFGPFGDGATCIGNAQYPPGRKVARYVPDARC